MVFLRFTLKLPFAVNATLHKTYATIKNWKQELYILTKKFMLINIQRDRYNIYNSMGQALLPCRQWLT